MKERFAAYGFELEVPDDWRIEFNAKNTREKGDVAFHSALNNVFFVSWGKLADAQKKYPSLEAYRDDTVARLRKNPNMKKADMTYSAKRMVGPHEGVVTKVVAQRRGGMMSRSMPDHDIWSVHFYCPQKGRFYVAYWHLHDDKEFPVADGRFNQLVDTLVCHR